MNLPGTFSWVIKDSMYNAMKKIHELQDEDILGFSTSLKTLASTFNQYWKVFQW